MLKGPHEFKTFNNTFQLQNSAERGIRIQTETHKDFTTDDPEESASTDSPDMRYTGTNESKAGSLHGGAGQAHSLSV